MDSNHFPHASLGGTQLEYYVMDVYPLNTHINFAKWDWAKQYFDIRSTFRFEDDFFGLDTTKWTIAENGDGSQALTDAADGVLLLTNAAADDNDSTVRTAAQSFILKSAYPVYVEGRFKISDEIQSDFYFGLVDAEWFAGSTQHGVYFHKDDGDANLDIAVEDGNTVVTADTTLDWAALTWRVFGIHYDGAGTVRWFIWSDAGVLLATGEITTGFPLDEELYLGFGVQNGEAVAKSLYVDYVKVAGKRVI